MSLQSDLKQMTTLLTVKELSVRLGSHPQTVYNWVAEGKLPHVRVCGRVKFDGPTVADWLERRTLAGK